MYKGALSIFKDAPLPQPIIPRSRHELEDLLHSTAKLERLAIKSINDKASDRYFLESIPSDMFLMFADSENPAIAYSDPPHVLTLLSSGSLSIDNDEEFDEDEARRVIETPYKLDIEAYKKRRAEQSQIIDLSEMNSTASSAAEDVTMAEANQQGTAPIQQGDVVVMDEEFAPNTQDVNDMLEDILGPNSGIVDQGQTNGTSPIIETSTLTSPPPPSTTKAPATVSTNTSTLPIDKNDWINDIEMILTDQPTPDSQVIYAFPKKMIPVYPTMEQRSECDKTTAASRTKTNLFFNMHFEKSISTLYLPSSNMDYTPEEQWKVSGKLMVLKRLFDSLLDKDIILLIVVKDMGEEEMLIELIKDNLKLDCVRMNYVLQDWEGEYGIFVKTKNQVDQQRGTAERSSNFEAVADFIISLDIRAKTDEALAKIVTKRDSPDLPPTACLISLGSVEERAFTYLEKHHLSFSDSKSDEFKDLIRLNNEWPENVDSVEQLNTMVAENIKSWLFSTKRTQDHYQYRSVVKVPRSIILGTKKTDAHAPNVIVPTVVPAEDTGSDMEIESDPDVLPEVPLLSEKGTDFINNNLFPLFDTNTGKLPITPAEPILATLPESDLRKFKLLPPKMQTEYTAEVNTLKRQYEEAFKELQNKYRERAFSALRNQ